MVDQRGIAMSCTILISLLLGLASPSWADEQPGAEEVQRLMGEIKAEGGTFVPFRGDVKPPSAWYVLLSESTLSEEVVRKIARVPGVVLLDLPKATLTSAEVELL